ncbi:hypothetical protein SDC9_204407 [bioreactor metagenome]|uniref:Uncharacterized protein n=1 Tax=bioreactor metagenome TaxID=1076179 RepID=A0A645IZ48_9ZZZZ
MKDTPFPVLFHRDIAALVVYAKVHMNYDVIRDRECQITGCVCQTILAAFHHSREAADKIIDLIINNGDYGLAGLVDIAPVPIFLYFRQAVFKRIC